MSIPPSLQNNGFNHRYTLQEGSQKIKRQPARQRTFYEIPIASPSYDAVIARSILFEMESLLNVSDYNCAIRVLLPDENDWNRLCEFDDFMGNNIKTIDKQRHSTTCKKLFFHDPRLYRWLYATSQKESLDKTEPSMQYRALSLDWSRSYYCANRLEPISENSFNWRKLTPPEDIVVKRVASSKSPTSARIIKRADNVHKVSASTKLKLALAGSVRTSVLMKILKAWCQELSKNPKNRRNLDVVNFNQCLEAFLYETTNEPQNTKAHWLQGQVILKMANKLIEQGIENDLNDFHSFPKTLTRYIHRVCV
ncbi:hypothetical protein D5018_18360 [Parashewanella curva]|uniref:Uncharacterized protein n=1 Tax=Parashewanella curva TaxID=2338552 RepID=A0A3L8PS66_9GAMM|nr:hypothetical protein [Parashewanella curva]RLV58241.1 hypothetical protein D5018_18360 [Parashewanella curva]